VKKFFYTVGCVCGLTVLVSCAAVKNAGVVSSWTEEEKARDVALRTLKVTKEASFHLVRVRTGEKPHVHDSHDGTVFVLSGRFLVYLGDLTVTVGPGDVLEIPRGVVHWAENIHPDASEAYVIFTPPYDEKDWRPVSRRP